MGRTAATARTAQDVGMDRRSPATAPRAALEPPPATGPAIPPSRRPPPPDGLAPREAHAAPVPAQAAAAGHVGFARDLTCRRAPVPALRQRDGGPAGPRNRLPRLRRDGQLLGPPSAMPRVRPHRLLRQQCQPACDRALP